MVGLAGGVTGMVKVGCDVAVMAMVGLDRRVAIVVGAAVLIDEV